MALALLENGFRVVAMGRSKERLTTFSKDVHDRGGAEQLLTVSGDVTSGEQCRLVVDAALERFGQIDILINNAGAHLSADASPKFYELSEADWRRVFDTNTTGAFLMASAVTPRLIERGWGRILNIQTSYATMLRAGMNPYGPSKAAIEAATVAWAADLAGTGVTVNQLLPGGAVDVPRILAEVYPDRSKLVAPGVMIAPLLWLVSPAADAFTGHRIVANRWDPGAGIEQNLRASAELSGWRGAANTPGGTA